MYTLTPEEKTTPVMIYTHDTLVRGEVITKENVRVSSWLRTQGMPEFMHVLKAQVLYFGSGSIKSTTYPEIYVSTATIIGFHLLPPAQDPLDYTEDEKNRILEPVTAHVGSFLFKGKLRISSQTGLSTSLESGRAVWLSIYEVEVTNPYLPQMPPMHVNLILMNPKQVNFAIEAS
jgi:hypothetical protein